MSAHDEDAPTGPKGADRYPSAQALVELGGLLSRAKSPERSRTAWRTVTAASGNPDFHAVIDFAMENELVSGCENIDPAAPNVSWVNPTDGSELVLSGPPPSAAVRQHAQRRRVRLRTFAGFQGLLDLSRYTDALAERLRVDPGYPPEYYVPHTQAPDREMVLAVRSEQDARTLATTIRDELRNIDPDIPLANVRTLDAVVADSIAPRAARLTCSST